MLLTLCHLESNSLLPKQQSGLRKFHSTESRLWHILADNFGIVVRGHVTLLVLFDVSMPLDTVDLGILLERLAESFGVYWVALTVG